MSTVRHRVRYIIVFFSSEELISYETLIYHQVESNNESFMFINKIKPWLK